MKHLIFLLAVVGSPAFASNLVVNGGFETGNLSGWTITGQPQFFLTCANRTQLMGVFCTSFAGTEAGAFGPPTTETISQTITTIPGDRYNVFFVLRSDSLGKTPNNAFDATFAGAAIDLINLTSGPYKSYSLNGVLATSTATTLTFSLDNVPGAFLLDGVSVTEVPEPAMLIPAALLIGLGSLRRRKPAIALR